MIAIYTIIIPPCQIYYREGKGDVMNNCFRIDNNELHVLYQPINDLDVFARYCMRMLASTVEPKVYIIMDNSMGSISSAYIGVLMSCAMLSDQMGKELHIQCSDSVKRLINILDGHKLMQFVD